MVSLPFVRLAPVKVCRSAVLQVIMALVVGLLEKEEPGLAVLKSRLLELRLSSV